MQNKSEIYDKNFERKYYYGGNDLGAVYTPRSTRFRVWAPLADSVFVRIYNDGAAAVMRSENVMAKSRGGTWYVKLEGDFDGAYYTYVINEGGQTRETVDIYAKACSANGKAGQIINLKATTPKGFARRKLPQLQSPVDAVIYELHIRDYTIDKSGNFVNSGKYLALTENGTKNYAGELTGLGHLTEMGVTHIQLLPVADFCSVDEESGEGYNWGYDPMNYNVPEGSYATDVNNGAVRVRELKELIDALHKAGIRVVLDVVYNHTGLTEMSGFHKTVPYYYHRTSADDAFSDGSGCGNETASERAMMRKFIIDSVCYWAKEYHVDGFRFDLMGLHDIKTMRAVRKALDGINPSILVYGEGWTGGISMLPSEERALKANADKMKGIAFFSDNIRDAIKGSVFGDDKKGFVNGGDCADAIKSGVVAGVKHRGVKGKPWAKSPEQVINYCECHDNYTLWDKLMITQPAAPERDRIKMDKLAAAIVFTSQGIPFIHEGQEFLRSKTDENGRPASNSYNLPDSVNAIDWDMKTLNKDVTAYYKGLIALRKSHPAFRLTDGAQIRKAIKFSSTDDECVVAYKITTENEKIVVVYNSSAGSRLVKIPMGKWRVYVDSERAAAKPVSKIRGGGIVVPGYSALVVGKPNYDKLRNAAIATGVVVAGAVAVKLIMSDEDRANKIKKKVAHETFEATKSLAKFTGEAAKKLPKPKPLSIKEITAIASESKKFLDKLSEITSDKK